MGRPGTTGLTRWHIRETRPNGAIGGGDGERGACGYSGIACAMRAGVMAMVVRGSASELRPPTNL